MKERKKDSRLWGRTHLFGAFRKGICEVPSFIICTGNIKKEEGKRKRKEKQKEGKRGGNGGEGGI